MNKKKEANQEQKSTNFKQIFIEDEKGEKSSTKCILTGDSLGIIRGLRANRETFFFAFLSFFLLPPPPSLCLLVRLLLRLLRLLLHLLRLLVSTYSELTLTPADAAMYGHHFQTCYFERYLFINVI